MPDLRKIVILTGAGISAESGLATFRAEGGLWARHRIEDVATPEAFRRDPALVQNFYNSRRRELAGVAPAAAHLALARLAREHPGEVVLITQNVDDLHERAGSASVLHMHGELLRARCLACGVASPWPGDIGEGDRCPACGSDALRPHIVWFGEIPFHLDMIEAALADADLFLSIGTSGEVWPAAGFVAAVRAHGRAPRIEFNLGPTGVRDAFTDGRYGPAGETVPGFVEELLGGHDQG